MSASVDDDLKAALGKPFWLSRGVCMATLTDALARSPDIMGKSTYGGVKETFKTSTQRRMSAGDVEEVQFYKKKNKTMIQQRMCLVDCRGQVYQFWALALGLFGVCSMQLGTLGKSWTLSAELPFKALRFLLLF